jgi:pimeloyl-ACP methyl ester carboxylesterase
MALLLAILAGAAIYNSWAFYHYRALYPPPGKIYPVGGYGLHLNCTGSGSPTIVLEAGMGNDWMVWRKVQPELAKLTRVCSYDRAGYGWSDFRPGTRDANAIADQLHELLSTAGIAPPVVLMGHSIAGMYLRAYLAKYPSGIVGLVLLDGSTPEQVKELPVEVNQMQRTFVARLSWYRPLIALGLARLVGQCGDVDASVSGEYAQWLKGDNNCNPGLIETYRREAENIETSAAQTLRTGPFADLPFLIFSQDPDASSPGLPQDLQRKTAVAWTSLQERLKKLSSRSRRIVAKGSSHYVQFDRPELVNREVSLFIREIRGEAAPASDWGSTKTE